MTEEEFGIAIAKRHVSKDKNKPGINAEVLKDIRAIIAPITDQERDELFEWYTKTWRANGAPRAGFFADRMRETGHKIKHSYRGLMSGAWECGECGTKYSLVSQGCPRCGSPLTRQVVDASHPAVVEVKIDCWQCKVYKGDGGGKFGPECDHWGDGSKPYDYCRDCSCRACCSFEYSFRRNPKGIQGQSMPWIQEKKK